MGFLCSLSSVQWHPATRCFSAGLRDLTGDPEDLGKPPSGYCRCGIHGVGWACGEKASKERKNLGRLPREETEMKSFHAQEGDGNSSRMTFWKGSMGGVGMKVVLECCG